jgi:hypothetical protein
MTQPRPPARLQPVSSPKTRPTTMLPSTTGGIAHSLNVCEKTRVAVIRRRHSVYSEERRERQTFAQACPSSLALMAIESCGVISSPFSQVAEFRQLLPPLGSREGSHRVIRQREATHLARGAIGGRRILYHWHDWLLAGRDGVREAGRLFFAGGWYRIAP